ncbi:hypothetical protein HMPREF1544_01625 [Mucor circinelloides 1006PhL]|uniref:VASt domain-containing protein n=1 Tax=Mucor circinelloides f. circinelloides (strain 1006PhL) TaxID=1220926 RepID=S2JNG8_MUCC1|nr:hypothetical protein HMPREF1544_01625 [Mucor circinelloides 1006PhL]
MIAVQSDKSQHPSRAPSPVPSTIPPSATAESHPHNRSSPKLPLPISNHRRSSFSTDVLNGQYEEKPLVSQRSFPHLTSRKQKQQRRGSDAVSSTDDMGSDGSFSISASAESSTVALPNTTRFANDKRNNDFHALFRSVPDQERLIDDYGCALQKEILLQGRVYISEHHLCFNANIFGWITNLVIAFADIEDIEKRSTAIFIPNAILISTCSSKHFLASFLSRDQAYDQMVEIWKASRANSSTIQVHASGFKNDDASEFSGSDDSDYTSSDYSYSDEDEEDDKLDGDLATTSGQINDNNNNSTLSDRQASLASLPLPKHLSSADEAARRRAVSEAGPRPNMQEYIKKSTESTATSTAAAAVAAAVSTASNVSENSTTVADASTITKNAENAGEKKDVQIKETTECECSKTDQHFPTVVMDNKYNTTIETMYNLLYNSTFMNKFLCEVEKKVCIGEWSKNDGCVHARESSYIKYLGGSIGPKSTKCYLKEEVLHLDTTDYVSQLTVTQTPDVPSGGSFSVKTRTCISWCGQGQVRVLVTVLVDFTKSSWLKSTIEKASIDGQQNFYKSLDAAVRKYLDSHAGDTKRLANSGKKKGGKRRHRHRNHADKNQDSASNSATATAPASATEKQHVVIETLSSILNWLISNASAPTTSQLTAICMAMMVITNLYIASKMAGVDKQLNQLQNHKRHGSEFYQHHIEIGDDDNSLWRLLSRLDPDARKEDLHFVRQARQPLSDPANHSHGDEEAISDEQLQFSRLAKQKLDKQMVELEKMIQKAGQSMEQVTHAVQHQRKRILDPDFI